MEFSGIVRDGVVIPPEGISLPEGVCVRIVVDENAESDSQEPTVRVSLPIVKTHSPGTLNLTNKKVVGYLDDQDAAGHQCLDRPDL